MTEPRYTMPDIRAANARGGFYFFDKKTMRFFNSRIYPTVYQGKGGVYFLTSEGDDILPRRWSVRQFHPATGNVTTVRGLDRCSASRKSAALLASLCADGEQVASLAAAIRTEEDG